ncbi:MAG: hypothetical protein HY820_08950 [Acidobacteria bacterium]|nr:hypothetical protein [Acidobacteriota bacterium]
MNPALLVKLRPVTPWRIAPDDGARDRVGSIYHSDTLYSAVSLAMQGFGWLDRWLAATTGSAEPAVRFTSCYPFHQQTLLIAPPRNLWPPPPSTRQRWKAARFVPLKVVETLLEPNGRLREDDWVVDGESECVLPVSRSGRLAGPLRRAMRRTVPVDRITGNTGDPGTTACLEFSADSGLWFVAVFASDEARTEWAGPVQTCIRLLADSGFGGERSLGWGRSAPPEFQEGVFPGLVLVPKAVPPPAPPPPPPPPPEPPVEAAPVEGVESETAPPPPPAEMAYWLLSVFRPGEQDGVDWTRGSYSLVERSGRVDSLAAAGEQKKNLRMVSEGSVVFSTSALSGSAADVAPDDFPHPVYRAGYALAIPIPWKVVG